MLLVYFALLSPGFMMWELTSLIWDFFSILMYMFNAVRFIFNIALLVSHKFWYVYFCFHAIKCTSKIFPLKLPFWPMDNSKVYCLVLKCLEIVLLSCYWFLFWLHYSQWTYSEWFILFLMNWCLFYDFGFGLLWYMFYGNLKKMDILQMLDDVLHKCL